MPARLVVELAGKPAALELLTGDRPAKRVGGHAAASVDRDRGLAAKVFGHPQVFIGEPTVAARACRMPR